MDFIDDDMFALSDEELPTSFPKCNPVEEHLMKQLSDVQIRIEKVKHDIKEIQDMTKRSLKSLYSQAQYGKDINPNSDNDLYTADGQPVVKKMKHKDDNHPPAFLIIGNTWKYILSDKWVIGMELMLSRSININKKTLKNVQIYVSYKEDGEFCGASIIWKLVNQALWDRSDEIGPDSKAVATIVLDLPKFNKDSSFKVYGTISYEIDEEQYQTPLPIIRLNIDDVMNSSYQVQMLTEQNCIALPLTAVYTIPVILTLKSTSVEKTIDIQMRANPKREKKLVKFLKEKSFQEIYTDVYIASGCLTHCLVEILRIIEGEEKLRISARTNQQMTIILRLLTDEFSNIVIEEDVNPLRAAMVLMAELNLYLEDASTTERQMARIKTDLLIP